MKRLLTFLFISFLIFSPKILFAQPQYAAHTKVELLSDVKSLRPGGTYRLAIKMTMDDGWHVYWKNPGDSGLTPTAEWQLPAGFKMSEIHWPIPQKIVLGPLTSYGYVGQVWLITDVSVPDDLPVNQDVALTAKIEWLTCQVDCIPGKAELEISFPVINQIPAVDTSISSQLDQETLRWPVQSPDWDFAAYNRDGQIELEIISKKDASPIRDVYFYPDRSDLIDHAAQQTIKTRPNGIILSLPKANIFPKNGVSSLQGILVRPDGWQGGSKEQAIAVDTVLREFTLSEEPKVQSMNLMVACVFAFIGGLILNLMPCVLPVLSLKILGLIKHSKDRLKLIQHAMLYAGGVIVSFWLLAALLILFKAAGHQIGWGFQFQSPYFNAFMAALLCLLTLNLFGVFEVASFTSAGTEKKQGFASSFLSGVLATAVATPCTAPFMGAALGFALTQSAVSSLLIFTCLGAGMAAPYVLLSAFPFLLKWLPRPGSWMNNLKIFLGFILLASVVWLVWVLGIQKGINNAGLLLYGLLFISIGGWLLGLIQNEQSSWFKNFVLSISFLIGFVLLAVSASAPDVSRKSVAKEVSRGIDWKVYSPELVEDLLKQKKAVFIDFTAAWCLSCQFNDRLVFHHPQVAEAFREQSIEAVKADWTNKDSVIARALQSYGKDSIPLYVYYPAGSSQADIWPELITPEMVLRRIRHTKEIH